MPRKRDEINKFIHERIRGLCWHTWGKPHVADRGGVVVLCERCKVGRDGLLDGHFNPQYCSDDSPRSLLNEVRDVTVQRVGYEDYIYALLLIRVPDEEDEGVNFYKIASATAEQIARACVEAWEARGNGK